MNIFSRHYHYSPFCSLDLWFIHNNLTHEIVNSRGFDGISDETLRYWIDLADKVPPHTHPEIFASALMLQWDFERELAKREQE